MPDSIPETKESMSFKDECIAGNKLSWNGVDYSVFTEKQKKKVRAYYVAMVTFVDQYKNIVMELDQIMINEIYDFIQTANDEKLVNRGGISGEGSFEERGWKRTYPSKDTFYIRL